MTKAAWIRNENAPAGGRSLGHLNCSCGKAPESRYCEKGGDVFCSCGRLFSWDGFIKQEPLTIPENLFVGAYPTGWVYADKKVAKNHDYKTVAFLPFDTLELDLYKDCPADLAKYIKQDARALQMRIGEEFQITTSGQTILLGSAFASFDEILRSRKNFVNDQIAQFGTVSEFVSNRAYNYSLGTIKAYQFRYRQVWLVNVQPSLSGHLGQKRWYGEKIYNFDYRVVMPNYDAELDRMIEHYNRPRGDLRDLPALEQVNKFAHLWDEIEKISNYVAEKGGDYLIWS